MIFQMLIQALNLAITLLIKHTFEIQTLATKKIKMAAIFKDDRYKKSLCNDLNNVSIVSYVLTVVSPNCERSTSTETFFFAIFNMSAISDTQMIYMYASTFNVNDLCVNLFIVFTMKKRT